MEPVLTLGPITVTPFGLIVFAGALCGVLLSLRKKEVGPVLPFVILGALLFGHMWWVFFCPPGYSAEIGAAALMLRIWEGGYTLYGALFGGLVGAIIGTKLAGLRLTDVLDALAPGACAALFFCRLGEYFTGQSYLAPVSAELVLLAVLLIRARKARPGQQSMFFVTVLGTTQILLEQFRRDDFVRLNPFVRFTQIAALLSLITVLILLVYRYRPGRKLVIASFAELTFASLAAVFAAFVFEKPQFRVLLYVFAVLSALGFAVLLRMYRGRFRLPASVLMLLCTCALLAVHIADQWINDAWMLYSLMALALLAIGTVVFLNAEPRTVLREN